MSIWILIWRLNPPHIGHMKIINESFIKNDKTILFLGSSNILDNNNPYSYEIRKEFIIELYKNNKYYNNLIIENLDDMIDDKNWVLNIKIKLEKYLKDKNTKIIFYGWDFNTDYAIIILKKYIDLLWFNNILFKEISRKEITVIHNNEKLEISSTKVREAIKNKDNKLLEKLIDKKLINKIL